jgi:hypothetical protein
MVKKYCKAITKKCPFAQEDATCGDSACNCKYIMFVQVNDAESLILEYLKKVAIQNNKILSQLQKTK